MKKTHKNIFGLFGLFVVVATTIFATALPSPGTLAATSSVTDKIVVRVLATSPNVEITKPKNGDVFVNPIQTIDYTYEKVENGVVTLIYTDLNGSTNSYIIDSFTSTDPQGSGSVTVDLSAANYGYGSYVIKLNGTANSGLTDEDLVSFSYIPITIDAKDDPGTGEPTAYVEYDNNNADIDTIKIEIYDQNGNPVILSKPITIKRPNKTAILDFTADNLPDGTYTIVAVAYDNSGNPIGNPAYTTYDYAKVPIPDTNTPTTPTTPSTNAPDTGGLFNGLNISRSDYLISGLFIFFLVGLGGLYFIAKKSSKRR
ncbi:hypothetical protein IKF57_02555 [Candidatus Saccharibacteria bacterium]|nr:hypothetical protein [Candidatus Saccharibacteria bacterium]